MTVMATTTPARPRTPGPRRVDPPVPVVASRRLVMVPACYAGIALMIVAVVLAGRVLPAGIGVPLLAVLLAAVVAVAHPRVKFARRTR